MKVIAIASGASNNGKTCLVLGLAQSIHRLSKRVLVIDLTGDLTKFGVKNITPKCIDEDIHSAYWNKQKLTNIIVSTKFFDLIPLCSLNAKKPQLCQLLQQGPLWQHILRAMIRETTMYNWADQYDFVVLDTNRSSSSIKSAIIAADTVLIPTSGDLYNNYGVWNTMEDVAQFNPQAQIAVFRNECEPWIAGEEFETDVQVDGKKWSFSEYLLNSKIRYSSYINRVRLGKPLSNYQQLSVDFLEFTKELLALCENASP